MKKTPLPLGAVTLMLGPLLAATIRDHKDGIAAARKGEMQPDEFVGLTCALVHACAQRLDATVTLDQVEQLIDLENMGRAFAACWGVSVPEPMPGEAVQAGSPST